MELNYLDNEEDEVALRAHIRSNLLQYALDHLTIDHVAFTQQGVSDVLSELLFQISTSDPTSLALPVDPFVTLLGPCGYNAKNLTPYDQRLGITPDASAYIRDIFTSMSSNTAKGGTKSQRVFLEEGNDEYDLINPPHRPLTPILTRRAVRSTPQFGSSSTISKHTLPKSFTDVNRRLRVKTVEVFEHPAPEIQLDQALSLRLSISTDTQKSILSLLKTVPFALKRPAVSPATTPPSLNFLHSNSPPLRRPLRTLSPPLFHRPRHSVNPPSAKGKEKRNDEIEVAKIIRETLKMDDTDTFHLEEDVDAANLILVDGWQAFPGLPPTSPAPSLQSAHASSNSTQESDQLVWEPSPSPEVPYSKQTLIATRMDEIEIPRLGRYGSSTGPKAYQNLSDSLEAFLPIPLSTIPSPPQKPRRLPSPTLSVSVLGQPPTTAADAEVIDLTDSDDEIENTVRKVCEPVKGNGAESWILDERIDEKDGLMMDVPKLPEPNIHPPSKDLVIPTSLSSLLAQKKPTSTASSDVGLSRVKGIQSLNIELTWRPFITATEAPTHESLSSVHLDVPEEAISLIRDISSVDNETARIERAFESDGGVLSTKKPDEKETMVLTRAERKRIAGDVSRIESHPSSSIIASQQDSSSHKRPHSPSPSLPPQTQASKTSFLALSFDESSQLHPDAGTKFFPSDDMDVDMPARKMMRYQDELAEEREYDDFGFVDGLGVGGGEYEEEAPYAGVASAGQSSAFELENYIGNDRFLVAQQPKADPLHAAQEDRSLQPTNQDDKDGPPRNAKEAAKFSARTSLAEFMQLRARRGSFPPEEASSQPQESAFVLPEPSPPRPPIVVPSELVDANAIALPDTWYPPTRIHRYICSMSLIQKPALISHLSNLSTCAIELVERTSLQNGSADLLLDSHTAVIYATLSELPALSESLVGRLSSLSWSFSRILVIFESYSVSESFFADEEDARDKLHRVNPFSPPVIKAVKRLRRDVHIAEGSGTKNGAARVEYVCALDVKEAALFARALGDELEVTSGSSKSVLWNEREWLYDEELDGETDLAASAGMNLFSAIAILSRVSLSDLLSMSAESRLHHFGALVGQDRIERFNRGLAERMEAFEDSPVASPL